MSFLNLMPEVAAFAIFVDSFSILVAALSRQSNDVAITSTIICLIAVADSHSAPLVTALSSWGRVYWLTVMKSDSSDILRMRVVMWAPKITMISSAITSLTSISVRQAVFCMYASSWVLDLVMISGATTQSGVLAVAASAIDLPRSS